MFKTLISKRTLLRGIRPVQRQVIQSQVFREVRAYSAKVGGGLEAAERQSMEEAREFIKAAKESTPIVALEKMEEW